MNGKMRGAECGITEQDFSCMRGKLTIRGRACLPETGGKLPAVIVSHGFGSNWRDTIEDCRDIASWGYAVYCYDFCGGGVESRSDGKTTEMTVLTEREDLLCVMDYVRALDCVDAGRLILMGYSQGGFVSALTAAARPKEVSALVMVFPALCIPDDARRGVLAFAPYDVSHVPDTIDCGGMVIGRCYHDAVYGMDPYAEISPYAGPVLILHGTSDGMVDYHYSVRAKERYAPGQCHLELIKGAGHGFSPEIAAASRVSVRQFLLGKKEILTIDVRITGVEPRREGRESQQAVLFTGSSESEYFKGTILPGAEDVQDFEDGKIVRLRADYTLEGTDREGQRCRIHIVNTNVGEEWKPTVQTDSAALAFLNDADLTAALEGFEGGLTVRIFG